MSENIGNYKVIGSNSQEFKTNILLHPGEALVSFAHERNPEREKKPKTDPPPYNIRS